MALRQLGNGLLSALLGTARAVPAMDTTVLRGFRAVADVEVNLANRETLKKYVGVRDHLQKEPATRGSLAAALRELLEAVQVLPASSEYRRAVEATSNYRLKVVDANASEADVEEVLDAHLEELVAECKEEIKLLPLLAGVRRPMCAVCSVVQHLRLITQCLVV
jgi:NADH dehydrogenase (ubiquinone) 1 alpha subcomplex subunit 5